MGSLNERERRLRGRITPPAGPGPSEDYDEYMRMMNRDRAAIDRADAEALGNPADYDFGDDPEPEPVVEDADEPETESGDWYISMLQELRAEIPDDHPKAEVMDRAIEAERKELQKGAQR